MAKLRKNPIPLSVARANALAARVNSRELPNTPGTNISMRTMTTIHGTGNGPRKGKRPGSDKGRGEWRTVSQNYRDHATHDSSWDRTVSAWL